MRLADQERVQLPLADSLRGFGMTLTLVARKRSCPKCSWYSTAFPIESARMSIPSTEERSKYASQPSSPTMNPQASFLFSRVTLPRISVPLLTIAEPQFRFNAYMSYSFLHSSLYPYHSNT